MISLPFGDIYIVLSSCHCGCNFTTPAGLGFLPNRPPIPALFDLRRRTSLYLPNTMSTTAASELEDYNPFRSYSYDSDVKPSNDFRLYLPPPGSLPFPAQFPPPISWADISTLF